MKNKILGLPKAAVIVIGIVITALFLVLMNLVGGVVAHLTSITDSYTLQLIAEIGVAIYAIGMLFLMGYKPETSYEPRHSEKQIVPDEEYLDFLMEKMFLPDDRTAANRNAVMTWLTDHTETDGTITEITDSCYGRLLWEVTNQ